jgi:mono/diheme cytochrome c family protein
MKPGPQAATIDASRSTILEVSMRRLLVAVGCLVAALAVTTALRAQQSPASNPDSWQIPSGAPSEVNPVAASVQVLAKGKSLFTSKCERCHGATGVGNGPEADPDHMPGDLTDGARAARNPDGVLYYKIWNGRKKPKMPAFKTDMSQNDVWTVVHYIKTLRK